MWPEEDRFDVGPGRGSNGSDVVILSEHAGEPVPRPGRPYFINNMNITTSPGARVGDNYLNVTNVHHNDEVVYNLTCGKYMWAFVRNSTRAERVCCSASVVLLAAFLSLAVYFSIYYNPNPIVYDDEDWYISCKSWLAMAYDYNVDIQSDYEPLRLVIIQHSAKGYCQTSQECKNYVRNLQSWFINHRDRDIPYNFLVGNDGRVYEGRGWHKEGAFLPIYNRCSIGIGFIGDYRDVKPTESQVIRMNKLLDVGVKLGYLHPEYKIGAALYYQTEFYPPEEYVSPGPHLIEAMQHWPHYDHNGLFIKKNCSQITAMPFP